MPTTLFFLAGEASGDLHGAKLVTALREIDPSVRCTGMGGPKMAAAGMDVAKDLDGMQVMGFWEVAKQYGFFKKVFYELLDRVKQERPAALICIDYPGFNLRFAREVRKLGIPCLYYIVPQVWAWKPQRAAKMAEQIDRAYCVFEFEPPFFEKFRSKQRKMKTVFVGHPLLDGGLGIAEGPQREATELVEGADCRLRLPPGPKTVGLLPGSREAEVRAHRQPMLDALALLEGRTGGLRGLLSVPQAGRGGKGASVELIAAPGSLTEDAARVVRAWAERDLSHARYLPQASDFSVVKSGTSTLEAGLQGKPMCVVYRGSWASYALARLMVDIPVFSLVNIVLGRYVVPELLQREVNPRRIAAEIQRGLSDVGYIEKQRAALAELPGKLGGPGASRRAAQGMLDFLAGRE